MQIFSSAAVHIPPFSTSCPTWIKKSIEMRFIKTTSIQVKYRYHNGEENMTPFWLVAATLSKKGPSLRE